MSIEKIATDLTAALNRNSDLLEKMMAGAKGGTTAAAKTTAAKPATAKAKAKAAPTEEDLRTAFGAYMSGTKDKAERQTRKDYVAGIIAHFGVERVTDIAEENRDEALAYVAELEAGEVPDILAGGDEGGEDDDALL